MNFYLAFQLIKIRVDFQLLFMKKCTSYIKGLGQSGARKKGLNLLLYSGRRKKGMEFLSFKFY